MIKRILVLSLLLMNLAACQAPNGNVSETRFELNANQALSLTNYFLDYSITNEAELKQITVSESTTTNGLARYIASNSASETFTLILHPNVNWLDQGSITWRFRDQDQGVVEQTRVMAFSQVITLRNLILHWQQTS